MAVKPILEGRLDYDNAQELGTKKESLGDHVGGSILGRKSGIGMVRAD